MEQQTGTRAKAAIVYRIVPHYRVAFYNRLSDFLAERGVDLTVLGGQARPDEAFQESGHEVKGHVFAPNRYLHGMIYYQPLFRRLRDYDLVVMEQANSALLNYLLFARRALGSGPRLALWGHGDDLQQQAPARWRRGVKRLLSRRADHWFAYTDSVKGIVERMGYPADRITVVQNAIDVSAVAEVCGGLDDDGRAAVRRKLGLDDAPTAVFCARLTEGKGLPFLVDACERARQRVPGLQLAVVGGGPLEGWLREQAAERPWIRMLGARYGREKAEALAVSHVFLLPSFVGLSILDAFAAGLPVVTADFRNHSPEVDYLEHRRNGLFVPADPDFYADAVAAVLNDGGLRAGLRQGALATARLRTVDAMAANFGGGIIQALERAGRFNPTPAAGWPLRG